MAKTIFIVLWRSCTMAWMTMDSAVQTLESNSDNSPKIGQLRTRGYEQDSQ